MRVGEEHHTLYMTDTTSTYESDKKYQSLKKKVEQLFEKRKMMYSIESNYARFTAAFTEKHAASDDTRRYAADLLAHLKVHVYDAHVEMRNDKEIQAVRVKAADQTKQALESLVQEYTYAARLQVTSANRKAITDDYIKQKTALKKEYTRTLKAFDSGTDIEMLHRAQREVYSAQRRLRAYSDTLSPIGQEEYIRVVEEQLKSESNYKKSRVRKILM